MTMPKPNLGKMDKQRSINQSMHYEVDHVPNVIRKKCIFVTLPPMNELTWAKGFIVEDTKLLQELTK